MCLRIFNMETLFFQAERKCVLSLSLSNLQDGRELLLFLFVCLFFVVGFGFSFSSLTTFKDCNNHWQPLIMSNFSWYSTQSIQRLAKKCWAKTGKNKQLLSKLSSLNKYEGKKVPSFQQQMMKMTMQIFY